MIFFLKKLFRKKLLMISGAGSSIGYGLPTTMDFTSEIEKLIKADKATTKKSIDLYDIIISDLNNYFINPGIITFENIYQSIQDVRVIQSVPNDPHAYDEFRPHVGATHNLKNHYSTFKGIDGQLLQTSYLNNLLDCFLASINKATSLSSLKNAIQFLEREYILHSFTLNYDNLIDNAISCYETGFISGTQPRPFNQNSLLSSINKGKTIHCHLHGSLKWGFPSSKDPFKLHEFDTPSDGVKNSKSRPSGRPAQSGETLPTSPIITGMDKTELVFRQPFYSNFLAFFRSLELCSKLLITGYGFSDRHVNLGIEQSRTYRPNVCTYIVDFNPCDYPKKFIDVLTPDAWHSLLPGDATKAKTITKHPGWWKIPGLNSKRLNTSPIYLWLKGFDTFCSDVIKNGLPE